MELVSPATSSDLARQRFTSVLAYGGWVALVLHALFIPLFMALDEDLLAFVNLASVGLYAIALMLLGQGRESLALGIALFEVLAHAWIAVMLMGWNSGFHYYVLVMAPLIFLNPYWLPGLQLVLLTAVGALYLGLYEAVDRYGPVVPLPEGVLPLIHHLNVAAAFGLLSFFAYYFSRASVEADAELRRLATTDPLTGLDNRRRALEIAEAEVTRRGRSGEAFSLILGDVDGFKGINDQRGHDCGDIILVALAVRLREALRAQDTVARWGGEEFLVLLPETEERGARQVAEKVRAALLREPFRCRGGGIEVTMTFGVAEHAEGESLANALVRADRALLAGKRAGKNRVLVASELGPAGEREMTQFVITRQPGEE